MSKIKKKHVSMKKKSSWRKNTNIEDVEEFLEEQRLQERIGSKPDEKIFLEDKTPNVRKLSLRQEKKVRAQEPSKCFVALENNSKVEDPIKKRNRVRTPYERKHPLIKAKIQRNKELGIIPERELQSLKDQIAAGKKILKTKQKENVFNKDLWADDEEDNASKENPELDSMWVSKQLKQYHLKNLGDDKVKVPQITYEKRSQLDAIDPIAGTSYNPNKEDYEKLVGEVVTKEEAFMKQSRKLNQSLKPLYQKFSKAEIKRQRRTEIREGFPTNDENYAKDIDEQPSDNEYKTLNPPVRNKKKDLKQRRKQKETRLRSARKDLEKNELKKLKDLGMLKMYKKQIVKTEEEIKKKHETRLEKRQQKKFEPRRLARKKFEEEDVQVEDKPESLGNLRRVKPLGSILVDRFKSMQKRNILLPNIKRLPRKRRVTRITKRSHKEEAPQRITKKMRKAQSSKLQIHD